MSDEESPIFQVPDSKIDFRRIFTTDPNFTPVTNFKNSKIKFSGKICRFRGMICSNLYDLISDKLIDNLYELYWKTIQKITKTDNITMELFDILFNTFITFESFSTMAQILEFNIDISFVNFQNITRDM